MSTPSPSYDPNLGRQLLALARRVIESQLNGLPASVDPQKLPAAARDIRACFITLNTRQGNKEQLRGCIGSLAAHEPLFQNCVNNAVKAAFQDPRFPPMTKAEWPTVHISLSVLSAPQECTVDSREALEAALVPERDGLILIEGHKQATFLPSVWKTLPNPKLFIKQLLHKAGLPGDYWSGDMKALTYYTDYYQE